MFASYYSTIVYGTTCHVCNNIFPSPPESVPNVNRKTGTFPTTRCTLDWLARPVNLAVGKSDNSIILLLLLSRSNIVLYAAAVSTVPAHNTAHNTNTINCCASTLRVYYCILLDKYMYTKGTWGVGAHCRDTRRAKKEIIRNRQKEMRREKNGLREEISSCRYAIRRYSLL